jgi:two-component system, NtrC family, response regulator AtoC
VARAPDDPTLRVGHRKAPDTVALVVLGADRATTHVLPASGDLFLGRNDDATIRLDDPSVSRRHAVLRTGDELTIEDLGSANGTRVRGAPIAAGVPTPLALGDTIEIGEVLAVVHAARGKPGAVSVEPTSAIGAPPGIVVASEAMKALYRLLERISKSSISVLLLGETGVGKEVVAEALHRFSARRDAPFLRLNCAALSSTLLESELFGHERGAFTGAVQQKLGLLETAQGGTVFLDEVGELPLALQVKLLRVLEERRVTRVGGLKALPIDVRFVAATNRDLEAAMAENAFRRDLFFRLNGVSFVVPPLRERREEIAPLARAFAGAVDIRAEAMEQLAAHDWPGNVRELRNLVERAVAFSAGHAIGSEHVAGGLGTTPRSPQPLRETKRSAEAQAILDTLASCAGNQTRAAKVLGISRTTLVEKLDRYGIPRPRKGRR